MALGEVTKNDEAGEEDTAPRAVVNFLEGVSSLEVAETKKIGFGDDVSASLKRLSITVSEAVSNCPLRPNQPFAFPNCRRTAWPKWFPTASFLLPFIRRSQRFWSESAGSGADSDCGTSATTQSLRITACTYSQ